MTLNMEKIKSGGGPSFWPAIPKEYGRYEMYQAISDACYVYQYRDLEHNLRRFGWRQARKRVLRHGALSGEWVNRGRGELRLRRGGLEVRTEGGKLAVFGGKEGRGIALAGLAALAIGFAASELVKELSVRPRPFVGLGDVRLLVPEPSSFAFPSGHATSAFAAASGAVLAARRFLGGVPLWGWAMLALSTAISYSRVYVGVHYPTDVAAGVLLGVACGWIGAWWVACGWIGARWAARPRARPRTPKEA